MLLAIREKVQGWIAWTIVILLIVPFALWGIDQYTSGEKTVIVAEVNGETISATEFLQLYNRQRLRLQQQFADMYDQVVVDEELRSQVLDALIDSRLIKQWGQTEGLMISDQQLASMIQAADVFQENGVFSPTVYQDILNRNGLTVAGFELEQRQFLIESQFRALTANSTFMTASELERLYQLQNQRRYIDYLRMDQRVFRKKIQVTDEQVTNFYAENASNFLVPEKVVVDYVTLSQEEIVKEVKITDDQAREFYQTNIGLFNQPEARRARHILIRGDEATAREKMADVQAKLAAGEAFEELAKNYSEDPGSAVNGGDLDFFEQGMMVPEFDQVVFSMQVGQTSDVVKTDFGLHLIQLTDIREQQAQPYEEIAEEVKQQLSLETAERLYFERLETLNTLAYEQPDSLEPLLSVVDGGIKTSEAISREGAASGVMSLPRVVEAAFSDEVLKSRLNSTAIEVGPNSSIVLRVSQYQPEHQQAFDEVKSQIKEQLIGEAAKQKAAELADEVMAQIEAGKSPESLVRNGVEWHEVGWIERQNQQVLPQISQTAFKASKPKAEKPTWNRVQLFTGDTVLVRVSQVDVIENEERRSAMGQLEQAMISVYQSAELEARLAELKRTAKIDKRTIYQTVK